MNRVNVDSFEKLSGQLIAIYEEISALSKKNPNDAVNKFKLRFVNSLLVGSNAFLGGSYRPFPDFESFDPDDVPQNSDVVFMLGQYIQCFEKLRADNVTLKQGHWYWNLSGDEANPGDEKGRIYVRTIGPKKLRE